jgi:hypothetical protein
MAPIPEGCATELAQYLTSDIRRWDNLSPVALEKLVADVYRSNYKDAEVFHVGRPGDLGVDVLFIDSGMTSWLIQVKRRGSGKVEGFGTLQSLLGTLVLHGEPHGIVVSTADYFSSVAEQQRLRALQIGYEIHFVDRGKLHRMITPLLPDRPWLSLMDDKMFLGLDDEIREYFKQGTASPLRHDPRQLMLF